MARTQAAKRAAEKTEERIFGDVKSGVFFGDGFVGKDCGELVSKSDRGLLV